MDVSDKDKPSRRIMVIPAVSTPAYQWLSGSRRLIDIGDKKSYLSLLLYISTGHQLTILFVLLVCSLITVLISYFKMSGAPCVDCFSGTVHLGTPTGTTTTIHGLPVYAAKPPDGATPKGIIVMIPDACGSA